jgi:hypothetical protein
VSRNRVSRTLRQSGFPKSARNYAEWSTVRNPYNDGPQYVLPIGFKQSPLLASLVLHRSAVASAIEHAIGRGVLVSVYFDDLIGSWKHFYELTVAYNGIIAACDQANLPINEDKLIPPESEIVAFNCGLKHGRAMVTDARLDKFIAEKRGPLAEDAFIEYCLRVEKRNY